MKPKKGDYYELLFMPDDNRLFQVRRFYRKYRQPWAMVRSEKLQKNFPIPVKVLKSEYCRKTEPPIKKPVVIAHDDMNEVLNAMDEVEAPKPAGRIKGLFKRILARTV